MTRARCLSANHESYYESGGRGMKEATLVIGDDWEGVYVDGELVTQGHSINVKELLYKLGFFVEYAEADYEWLEEVGYLPENLNGVVLERTHE